MIWPLFFLFGDLNSELIKYKYPLNTVIYMASEKKPMDQGFKRTLKIVGGAAGIGMAVIGGFIYMSSSGSKAPPPPSSVGKVVPTADGEVTHTSPAAQERLARVQAKEAEAARRAGRSYIPDSTLGMPEEVPQSKPPPPPPRPPQSSYGQYQQSQQRTTRADDQLGALEDGLVRQMAAILNGMQPATAVDVSMMDIPEQQAVAANGGAGAQGAAGANAKDLGPILIGGDEIVPATVTTPVDTYKTLFALAEITGGPLAGAQLRGKVVPMSQSGDVEDVGLQFTSMRFNGQFYEINAIALNESTANDAMNGDVDRRIFNRYVMPVLMAGLSGVSTYFTAKGTPSTSVATDVGSDSSVIVNQERATREDAKNQGIGDAIDKGVQVGDREVQKEANRPQRVTLDAQTPIGIMFNLPVHQK